MGGRPAVGSPVSDGGAAARLLDPARTQLVVVDLQERLLPAIADRERVIGNAVVLLRLARTLELPVRLTTQYARGLGPTVAEVLAEAPGATPIDKTAFGCFGAQPFLDALRTEPRRDHLLVSGIETHICVAQTVLGALAAGYAVHVAADAVGSRSPENRERALARLERAGAVISTTEMAAYELLGRSDTAAFKAMLPHFR